MGQKVNPIGLRLGINRTWDSRWYADNDYADLLLQDVKLAIPVPPLACRIHLACTAAKIQPHVMPSLPAQAL